jgi:dGTP triphosphohydrolase
LDGEIIGQAIESLHAVIEVIENAAVSMRSAVDLVQKLKSTFNDCTSQILGLALKLRMVALNAQIFAAHVSTGASLEVVASNTRRVADEAMQQLDEISSRVTDVVDSVVVLEQRLRDYSELAMVEQSLLSNESAESENKLRALEQSLRSALGAITSLERELSETLHRTAGSIRFPEAASKAGARATAMFEQIALQYSDSSSGSAGASHHKVRELNRNYTMAHERVVHEAVSGRSTALDIDPAVEPDDPFTEQDDILAAGSEEPEPIPNGEVCDEELAGNVELF